MNLKAGFVINLVHEKICISQFALFATWFIRIFYKFDFSNFSGV